MANETSETYSAARNWLVTLPIFLLLLAAILFSTSTFIHAQFLHLGAQIWPQYSFLRMDMARPACNPDPNIDREVQRAVRKSKESTGGLLDAGPADPEALRKSFLARRKECHKKFEVYRYNHEMTQRWSLRAYRAVELGVGQLSRVGTGLQAFVLVLFILIGGIIAKVTDEHIALRVPSSRLDYRLSSFTQFFVNAVLAAASVWWLLTDRGATTVSPAALHWIWSAGFTILALISAWQFWHLPDKAEAGGNLRHALLTVPLYAWLGLAGLIYFFLMETYPSGLAIQLTKMIKFAELYTAVGLFIWVGMLLKHTRLAELVFDVLRPWEMAAEVIVIVVVLAAALPTAYTGASGIFVIAIGAVIYNELRIANTRRQLAIAATAMSGSMGVVLAPCLMIVIIAALNKQVTTTELYGWGVTVFGLSAFLFILFVAFTRESRPHIASPKKAVPPMLRALGPLVPYVLLGAAVIIVYKRVMGQDFNEFSAPVILPVMLLVFLAYDRWRSRRVVKRRTSPAVGAERTMPPGFFASARAATADTSVLVGALLLLMAMSVIFGGVVQRSGVMDAFPHHLGNIWLALAILDVILVLIGMFMDPYGAIILVSATIAPVAYSNGVDPVHFWMMVLVAFELGYLTPPVALNQLLTRQVIGEKEFYTARFEVMEGASFWRRHEHVLLPICIMGTSLLLVSFGPAIYMNLWS